MGYNIYQGQITGPFTKSAGAENIDLLSKIRENSDTTNFTYVWHLGITAEVGEQFYIKLFDSNSAKAIKIGKTGIYEIGNTKITGLYSLKNSLPANTIIDYVLYKREQ